VARQLSHRHCEECKRRSNPAFLSRGREAGLLRFARNDVGTYDFIPAAYFRPSAANSSSLSLTEGAGKAGRRLRPQHRVHWVVKNAHGFDRYSQDIPAFPAQWFYGLYVLSPGSGLSCPRSRRDLPPTWRQGRGARTTRFHRPPPTYHPARNSPDASSGHRNPHHALVTIRANVPHDGTGWADV
jgi:hypothetical protein